MDRRVTWLLMMIAFCLAIAIWLGLPCGMCAFGSMLFLYCVFGIDIGSPGIDDWEEPLDD